ncbi:Nicotinate phosphoribosyltransferase [Lonchura striata]|uniref:Nicotinate phosphoribosyltransferase n=1 Tax=Lonchura striata TaxID=40157 RepID=A0A218UA23_9PASE|nr:Nicotinate phosphoribosyltransferase [Lonchura striata domestica]
MAPLADLYQVSMAYGHWRAGRHRAPAAAELFFRRPPFRGSFALGAGLAEGLRGLRAFRFSAADVAYLRSVLPSTIDDAFFDYLATLDASEVTVSAIPEGSVVFARVPFLQVKGPLLVVQLLETTLLCLVNYASLVATNAARFRLLAGPDVKLIEMGLRCAQGPDGALSASKYSYIGGFDCTSNILAGKLYGIPVRGTIAHSFIMSFRCLEEVQARVSMAYGHWRAGRHRAPAAAELFFRRPPFRGSFALGAGLAEGLRGLRAFRFSAADVAYLRSVLPSTIDDAFFDYLATLDASEVTVSAIPEGSVVFARVPFLQVKGPLLVVQLLETTLLCLVNYASLVATNAARFRLLAGPDVKLIEMGLRCAQGPDGALSASKYSYIGGFDCTSNILAGKLYGIPVRGTIAHSFIMSFRCLEEVQARELPPRAGGDPVDLAGLAVSWLQRVCDLLQTPLGKANQGELAAFVSYAVTFPCDFQGLLDTYCVRRSGLPNFCAVALALHQLGYQAIGVRLDSGDLAQQSKEIRGVFQACGAQIWEPSRLWVLRVDPWILPNPSSFQVPWFGTIPIAVSNNISEQSLEEFRREELPPRAGGDPVDLAGLAVSWLQRVCDLLQTPLGKANQGELAAFVSYAVTFPCDFQGLLDTYCVRRSGLPNFCAVALALHQLGYQAIGVRLDSGDLAQQSKEIRGVFQACGAQIWEPSRLWVLRVDPWILPNPSSFQVPWFGTIPIAVSNNISEQSLEEFRRELVEVNGSPCLKLTEDEEKMTIPGMKTIYRLYDAAGHPFMDLMALEEEPSPSAGQELGIRVLGRLGETTKVIPTTVEPLHRTYFRDGQVCEPLPSLPEVRTHAQVSLNLLSPAHRRLHEPQPYPVALTERLHQLFQELSQGSH